MWFIESLLTSLLYCFSRESMSCSLLLLLSIQYATCTLTHTRMKSIQLLYKHKHTQTNSHFYTTKRTKYIKRPRFFFRFLCSTKPKLIDTRKLYTRHRPKHERMIRGLMTMKMGYLYSKESGFVDYFF